MADRPILFSGPMVRALLAGSKTQTRRVMPEQTLFRDGADGREIWTGFMGWQPIAWAFGNRGACGKGVLPRFALGDRLYVREAWSGLYAFRDTPPAQRQNLMTPDGALLREDVWFWADGNPDGGDYEKPRPGMHMPRWASRLTLIVTEVRVQRLQECSVADALAEGALVPPITDAFAKVHAISMYRAIWNGLNADRGFGWDANPWVVAVSFEVKRGNIDQIGGA